ncbi:MAG: FMN-binding protein [Defluviitaleaceae bacterium]|nr:FMN-binding protein [Defluviitaleaceae bacterium]
MKRKLLGVFLAGAMAAVLAACVYDDAGVATTPPTQNEQQAGPVLFPAITGTQTIRVSVPYGEVRNHDGSLTVGRLEEQGGTMWGPESVDALANAHAFSNQVDSGENFAPIVLDVTFTPHNIADIRLISHAETLGVVGAGTNSGVNYVAMVYPALTDQIIFHQSTLQLDAFAHATITRNAIVRGVNDAIAEAGGNPRELAPINQNATTPPAGARFIPGVAHIYVPAGTYVVMDNSAPVLDIRELTPELALELGMRNAEGGAANAAIQRHGVLHNGFRRQPHPSIEERLGLATPRTASEAALADTHYFHAANIADTNLTAGGQGLAMALNQTFDYNLSPGDPNPRAGLPRGMWMTVSFGFNTFWIQERGTRTQDDFSGLVMGGHGETQTGGFANPHNIAIGDEGTSVSNHALGSYAWSQSAVFIMNDQQSTHNAVDAQSNATMTATGVRVALEQAMRRHGATDATIAGMTPIAEPLFRTGRPQGGSTNNQAGGVNGGGNSAILRPGLYTTEIAPGVEVRVLLDRAIIRHFSIAQVGAGLTLANDTQIPGWTNDNWATFRNNVLFAYAENPPAGTGGAYRLERLQAVELMEGIAPETAQAILDFVIDTVVNNDVTVEHSNLNRLGASSGGTGRDRLPATPSIRR